MAFEEKVLNRDHKNLGNLEIIADGDEIQKCFRCIYCFVELLILIDCLYEKSDVLIFKLNRDG